MNASELIGKWPGIPADARAIFAREAWAMPVSYRGNDATLVRDATRERDVIGIDIAFDDEPHFLALAVSDDYPELRKVWEMRTKLPDEVLLALVEKECGPLFQTLENAVRHQLSVKGLADRETAKARNVAAQAFAVKDGDGETLCDFSLSCDGVVLAELGQLQNLDLAHESIRALTRPAWADYAAISLTSAELKALAPGDHLLLPEIGAEKPGWTVTMPDDGLAHVLSAATTELRFADFADETLPEPPPASALVLVHGGRIIAEGRLTQLGEQPALAIEGLKTL